MTLARVRSALARYVPRQVEAPEAKPAAVALVLVEGSSGLDALLIKRAERVGDPWSRQVALPGGRRDSVDSDLLMTAMREAREETGIDLRNAERLGALDDLYPRTPTLPPVVVRPFVFALPSQPQIVPNAEVAHAFWVSLQNLVAPGVRREITLRVAGQERVFPAYDLGDDVIWGMTERILTPFLELIGYAG